MQLPIDCEVGKTCELQNYVDRDEGPGARDYQCRAMTYNGHKGTDFRLPDLAAMREGVDVLAVASGRVLRMRDGMADVSVRQVGREALDGKDCGNGLVIDHGKGWETQYCHLHRGSIVVRPGEEVSPGQTLAQVGLSGLAEFPHVHVTVRHDGEVVDPFDYRPDVKAMESGSACSTSVRGASLWAEELRGALSYKEGTVLNSGFTDRPIKMDDIEAGALHSPGKDARAIVAYARAIGLRQNDVQDLEIVGPDGKMLVEHSADPLDNDKAQVFQLVGRRRPDQGWASGIYTATYRVKRDGEIITERTFKTTLP